MAAFSHNQDPSFFLDQSAFFPNPTTATAAPAAVVCFPQFHQPLNNHHAIHHHHDQTNSVSNKLHSPDSSLSMVLDEHKVESTPGNEFLPQKRKDKQVISYNAQSKDTNNNKMKKQKKTSDHQEEKRKKKSNKNSCEEEEGTVGYIHVRARRGQATDSHSLAERVRREKISERMKLLQAIVPGCDKVTGKALMLDEIINYVQSLQNQVEFLSMKLASVNPMLYDFGVDMDTFMLKPDENMSSMQVLPIMPSVQGSVNGEGGTFVPTNDNYNNYLLPQLVNHGSAVTSSLLFQHSQMPNVSSQGIGQQLWDVDEQRLKLDNRFVVSDSLTSFH